MRSFIVLVASALLMPLCILVTGCTSFTSTVLKRFDDNTYSGQSNGQDKELGQARPFKGIPITLKVPTHLDIYIDETYFVKLDERSATEVLDGKIRLLDVRTRVIKSDKVFTVDFKRPAAGFLDLDMTFDEEEQYFNKIISKLQDETITDTANLIATSIQTISALSASKNALSDPVKGALQLAQIEMDSRVVAFKRFDINAPTFEQDVECFVNQHLNGCNQCATPPTYDMPEVMSPTTAAASNTAERELIQ